MVLERIYNVNFSKIYSLGRHRERARKAIKVLRGFAGRHMKTVEEKVVIGQDVNELIWRNGIQKPPRKLRVKMMKDADGTVMVSLESRAEAKAPAAKEKLKVGKGAEKKAPVVKKKDAGPAQKGEKRSGTKKKNKDAEPESKV